MSDAESTISEAADAVEEASDTKALDVVARSGRHDRRRGGCDLVLLRVIDDRPIPSGVLDDDSHIVLAWRETIVVHREGDLAQRAWTGLRAVELVEIRRLPERPAG